MTIWRRFNLIGSRSNLVLAAGLVVLARAQGVIGLAAAWAMLGAGMALGRLYDTAFATLTGLYGRAARAPITGITRIAGLAAATGGEIASGCHTFTTRRHANPGVRVRHDLVRHRGHGLRICPVCLRSLGQVRPALLRPPRSSAPLKSRRAWSSSVPCAGFIRSSRPGSRPRCIPWVLGFWLRSGRQRSRLSRCFAELETAC
jgi:hypothetical protein